MKTLIRKIAYGLALSGIMVIMGAGLNSVQAGETDFTAALLMQQALMAQQTSQAQQSAALYQQAALAQVPVASQPAAQSPKTNTQAPASNVRDAVTPEAVIDGGTYIDVNKTTQMLSLIVGGQTTFVTPIVTGNVRGGHSTPTGVFNVYAKQTNRTLKGPNYTAFVKYWMPFYKGYGIHDANWRSTEEFGGATYQTSGSHGCVNIPPANMPSLYAAVSVGTPVIVHD